jgi:nucleotide-binding universal stress UspA family protein
MLRLIVVPLDGSGFGEQALPVALRLAQRERAEIELVHVHETLPPYMTQGAPVIDPRLDLELEKDRRAYLDAIATWLGRSASVQVTAVLLEGEVEPTLAEHIENHHADLVVMATHGRGGLSALWIGGVASELARHSSAPVLLVRPTESGSRAQAAPPFRRVLIPLDGTPAGEEAIDHVLAVAGDQGVEYLVLHVVTPMTYLGDPSGIALVSEIDLQQAMLAYLDEVAGRIRSRGFHVETRVDVHPSPARAILDVARARGTDLIAMETHGRNKAARLLLGSVTDKILRAATAPVLVHRPQAETREDERVQSAARSMNR